MTWAKFGDQYSDDIALAGLDDAAYRTHTEAIGWIYRVEATDLRIPRNVVRRFAGSPEYELAIKALLTAGFWREKADAYVIVHHAKVIRQSIAAQQAKRVNDADRQRRRRRKASADGTPDVTGGVTSGVTRDVAATQPTNHRSPPKVGERGVNPGRAESSNGEPQ